jgi:hypothetical protein
VRWYPRPKNGFRGSAMAAGNVPADLGFCRARRAVRFHGVGSLRRETIPTRDEAEKLIQPAIWEATVQALGDGDWQPSMNWLDLIELLGE